MIALLAEYATGLQQGIILCRRAELQRIDRAKQDQATILEMPPQQRQVVAASPILGRGALLLQYSDLLRLRQHAADLLADAPVAPHRRHDVDHLSELAQQTLNALALVELPLLQFLFGTLMKCCDTMD